MPTNPHVHEVKTTTPGAKEAAKDAAEEAVDRNGKRPPKEGDTPESERPQTQKLVTDGTDG